MARDNSEDALSWNVFRYIEKNKLLPKIVTILGVPIVNSANIIYWSFSNKDNKKWSYLDRASKEFGETIMRGSEPDIVIITDRTLFFIEAKFNSGNETIPSDLKNRKKYIRSCRPKCCR